ncbi:MAG: HepT-like ribonuclease domain-containing protein, partial [Fimbriimonadaceae bacterium]|nr:HepT-like ribonuclease domain-containing protein [Fimbriimonadaceae bacterium]
MRPETAASLFAMHLAATRAVEATAGRTFEEFGQDWRLQSAVERQFEVIGEALSGPMYQRFPDGEKIIGLRNVLSHGYDAVDPAVLWSIAAGRLPELIV